MTPSSWKQWWSRRSTKNNGNQTFIAPSVFSRCFTFCSPRFCTTDHTPSSAAAHSLTKLCLETIPDHGSSYFEQIYCVTPKEWWIDMWVASVDFQKAFDSIQHDAIREISQESFCQWAIHLSVFWKRCMLTNAPPSWHGFEICRGKSQVTRRAVFYPIRFSRTSVFETKRAWASNWERRKQIAYPTRDLLTTCLPWRILWNSSKGWWLTSDNAQKRKKLDIHKDITQILTSQNSNKLKEIEIDGIQAEFPFLERKVKFLGQMITFMN